MTTKFDAAPDFSKMSDAELRAYKSANHAAQLALRTLLLQADAALQALRATADAEWAAFAKANPTGVAVSTNIEAVPATASAAIEPPQ